MCGCRLRRLRYHRRLAAAILGVFLAAAYVAPSTAETVSLGGLIQRDLYSTNDFGGVGLLQTRTARFGHDGQFTVGGSFVNPYRRYYLNWQIFPWAEIGFRYSDITNVPPFGPFRGFEQSQWDFFKNLFSFKQGDSFLDRGFDIKFRLAEETKNGPAIAVGFQDFLGTGLFSGEYLVFSKRFGDWDLHVGLGWGYLGTRNTISNPLTQISSHFDSRAGFSGQGGNLGFDRYFSGKKVGIFGGLEYHTPIEGLSLKLEYSAADPAREPLRNPLKESFPINAGLTYRASDWADLTLAWERGNSLLLHVALRYNLHDSGTTKPDQGPPTAVRPDPSPTKKSDWSLTTVRPPPMSNFERQLSLFGLKLEKVVISGAEARVDVSGAAFAERPDFDARVAYALFDTLPEDVQTATLFLSDGTGSKELHRSEWLPHESTLSPEQMTRRVFGGFSFWVRSVQRRERVLEVEVEAPDWARERDYRIAADLIFEQAGDSVETITIKAMSRVEGIRRIVAYNPYLPLVPEPTLEQADLKVVDDAAQQLFKALRRYRYHGYALSINGDEATVYIDGVSTRSPSRNLGRVARVATQALPPSTDVITVVLLAGKIEAARVTIMRHDVENAAQFAGSPEEIAAHATIHDPHSKLKLSDNSVINEKSRRGLAWGIAPDFRQHLGDPGEGLVKFDVNLDVHLRYTFNPKLKISATFTRFLFGNISDITRVSNSILPHVRSDLVEFTQQGRTAITELKIDYVTQLSKNFFFRASGGILEWMYAGAGMEVLYRSYGSRWAFGADINWVKQRSFKQLFGLQKYNVVTGHFSIYHQFPVYGLGGSIHIGRYLAKDWGATVEIARRFKSGIEVGGFFTLTTVSAADFGEGSFDKGFFIRIPLDTILMRHSTRSATFLFRPLTRDGGQRVVNGPRLIGYAGLDARNQIRETWRDFMH